MVRGKMLGHHPTTDPCSVPSLAQANKIVWVHVKYLALRYSGLLCRDIKGLLNLRPS